MNETEFYNCRACKHCEGTKRYKANACCVRCVQERNARRQYQRQTSVVIYEGKPCKKCGNTERRNINNECANCHKERCARGRKKSTRLQMAKPGTPEAQLYADCQMRNAYLQRAWRATA